MARFSSSRESMYISLKYPHHIVKTGLLNGATRQWGSGSTWIRDCFMLILVGESNDYKETWNQRDAKITATRLKIRTKRQQRDTKRLQRDLKQWDAKITTETQWQTHKMTTKRQQLQRDPKQPQRDHKKMQNDHKKQQTQDDYKEMKTTATR